MGGDELKAGEFGCYLTLIVVHGDDGAWHIIWWYVYVGVGLVALRELGGLGCFGGDSAGGVLVALLVMVPPIRLSLRWWSWWAM